jgi:hypothetical protein
VSSSSTATTGEAGDDDVEEGCNTADDSVENAGNAVDNCHQASADGAEHRCDLYSYVSWDPCELGEVPPVAKRGLRKIRRHPF